MMNTFKLLLSIALAICSYLPASISYADITRLDRELNFVVSLPAPPSRLFKAWKPFSVHLQSKTGHNINLLTPKGLDKIEEMLLNKDADFIYINSYAFYLYKQKGLLEGIAQMRNKSGHISSRGRVLVRKDSNIKKLSDLRGGTVSLISPNGAGSYLAPKAFFKQQGMDMGTDINISYSGDLKKSVYEVLLNEANAAVMCGVNYDIINKKIDMQDIFVMELTDEFPEAVIAVRRDLEPELKQKLKDAITSMSNTYGGRRALTKLRNTKIYDFVEYDPAVEMQTQALMSKAEL